jgi:hypothetical protein
MGVTLPAKIIQDHESAVSTYSLTEDKKYGFEIYSIIGGESKLQIKSDPVFLSEGNAQIEGEWVLKGIKKYNFNGTPKDLFHRKDNRAKEKVD